VFDQRIFYYGAMVKLNERLFLWLFLAFIWRGILVGEALVSVCVHLFYGRKKIDSSVCMVGIRVA
jgi:hypothetical protein